MENFEGTIFTSIFFSNWMVLRLLARIAINPHAKTAEDGFTPPKIERHR